MTRASGYWDALAPHHSSLENNYFDLPSLRRIVHDIHQPVLVVGAGHGLIVAELRKRGLRADGVDLSSEMIRYAKTRPSAARERQRSGSAACRVGPTVSQTGFEETELLCIQQETFTWPRSRYGTPAWR